MVIAFRADVEVLDKFLTEDDLVTVAALHPHALRHAAGFVACCDR
jgi:hypothetical protein